MKTTAIIICAGEGERWGDYLGIPKHLIEIEGEVLVARTVRLLRENSVSDIYVVVKDCDDRYKASGSKLYVAQLNYEQNVDADKFLSSSSLWNRSGRTIVLYGDCYFTDTAMSKIVGHKDREWTLFCRPRYSRITGAKWPECFAQSFYDEHIDEHENALHRVSQLYKEGVIDRCGGWEHYRAMQRVPDREISKHIMLKGYLEINDWTEDFDYPEDYEMWAYNRKMYNELMRSRGGRKVLLYIFSLVRVSKRMLMRFFNKRLTGVAE